MGANINIQDGYGMTALMHATMSGHTEIVNVFIKAGADVNAKNNGDWSDLSIRESVDLKSDFEENYGDTALMCATCLGHTNVIKLLKDAGATE